MADDSGWLVKKCARHLAKKGWVCVKNADGSADQFFAAKRVGVDQQHSVGASTMMKMEHVDKAAAADKGQLWRRQKWKSLSHHPVYLYGESLMKYIQGAVRITLTSRARSAAAGPGRARGPRPVEARPQVEGVDVAR